MRIAANSRIVKWVQFSMRVRDWKLANITFIMMISSRLNSAQIEIEPITCAPKKGTWDWWLVLETGCDTAVIPRGLVKSWMLTKITCLSESLQHHVHTFILLEKFTVCHWSWSLQLHTYLSEAETLKSVDEVGAFCSINSDTSSN